ncbi:MULTISPECIES: hypothetical protein [unclassified Rathayibacter]|uniref:hypothetical protein n=1 Tax=unclassified Rathayibacter TaxID=2609250 RepID=UPI001052C86C|nr:MULTISPECIES: hypothetical protein [unclassified Rathayibacter]TCL80086.1 hypothetical protein EDF49_11031 [Rathayibacter sp. PhB192]TCM25527.1 hypothetical protein EDF43_11031 [Rathayibacter sp. PhB179]
MAFDADPDWDDTAEPFSLRVSRKRRARRLSAGEDRVTAILLLVLLLVFGAILFFLVLIEDMAVDACGGAPGVCDYELLAFATWLVPGAVSLTALLTIVALLRRDRSRRIWWIPVIGAAVAVFAFLIASLLVFLAVH